jgi:hypothetical protein
MRQVPALVGAVVLVLYTTASLAQGPNFGGTWVADQAAGAPGGGGGGGQRVGFGGPLAFNCGAECTIVQNAKTLTIRRAAGQSGQAPADVVINFTGETKLTQASAFGGPATDYTVTAKWDGARWVVTRVNVVQGASITITNTISIEDGKLTIVTTSTREGATPTRVTYSKKM